MRRTLAIAIATALGAASSSSVAVTLNPRGTGQVLIYPYFTVNHQQTLVSVINTTEHGKALKIRFREGYDGRDVANFNIYLGPFDSWVGSVYAASEDGNGAAAIATNDSSCTVGGFIGFGTPIPGFPRGSLTFSNANYSQGDYGTPTGTDHGPTNLARTREGFFEIIEMGEVVDQATGSPKTLEAITPVNGEPPGCGQVQNAWASGGYWTTNSTTDLLPPAGGLYGAAGIVDVAQGTLYAFDATAIEGFSDVVQHTGPGNGKPNLSTAVTDAAHDVATAYVPIGNSMIEADYPSSTRGVDAVSAVLAVDMLANEFVTDQGIGAASEWVVTLPTKHFYVDPAIVGTAPTNAVAPFENTFDSGISCFGVGFMTYDRNGPDPSCTLAPCPPPTGNYLCYETHLVTFNQPDVDSVPTTVFGSLLGANYSTPHQNGWFALSFADPIERLRSSLEGNIFYGLPVVGFLATNYINANVTPGVLSNYSAAYPHRSHASCTNSTTPQSACP